MEDDNNVGYLLVFRVLRVQFRQQARKDNKRQASSSTCHFQIPIGHTRTDSPIDNNTEVMCCMTPTVHIPSVLTTQSLYMSHRFFLYGKRPLAPQRSLKSSP